MQIEIIRSTQQWRSLAEEWDQLLENTITNVPFLRYRYLSTWWAHLGGGEWEAGELYILAGRDEAGKLVGAAPFFLSKNHAGKNILRLIGAVEISDFLDLLGLPESLQEFVDAVVEHLIGPEAVAWDEINLENLLETSPSLKALEQSAGQFGLTYAQERLQPAPSIALPEDFDTYLDSLDSRYRRELMRKMRNVLGYFIPVQVERVEEVEALEGAMTDFFAMMREESEKASFLTETMEKQMREIVATAFEDGWLDLRFLVVGRERAAGYLNFIYDGRVWVYNSSRAGKFTNLSPGIALMGLLVQEAIEAGYRDFDLMRGDEGYKYQMGGQDRWVVRATMTR